MQNKVRVLVITMALIMTLVIGAYAGMAYQYDSQTIYDVHIITYAEEGASIISDENYETTDATMNLWPIYSLRNISGYRITVTKK